MVCWSKQTETKKKVQQNNNDNHVVLIWVTEAPKIPAYLQERNEEKEGICCPPELRVEESRKEGEDVIFGCAEDRIKQQTRQWVEKEEKNKIGQLSNVIIWQQIRLLLKYCEITKTPVEKKSQVRAL